MPTTEKPRRSSRRGGFPAIIELFGINGLHGYRSISFSSTYAATILIARNGTGKTTLLGALDAVLKRQFYRLRDLIFERIYIRFRGMSSEISFSRHDLESVITVPDDGEIVRLARRIDLSSEMIFHFLTQDWSVLRHDNRAYFENTILSAVMRTVDYSYEKAQQVCDSAYRSIFTRNRNLSDVIKYIDEFTGHYDIVYLPTYRRVELALRGDPEESPHRKKKPRFDVAAGSLFIGDIQFGLSDISDRLADINSRIVSESNSGYRQISANIINDLIDGSFEAAAHLSRPIPSRDDLQLFFSRLENATYSFGYYPVSLPNLDKLYGGLGFPERTAAFLTYFLSQLETVISVTKEVEKSVEEFIFHCNKYLLNEEDADNSIKFRSYATIDGKKLVLDRMTMGVHVESVPGERVIPLDALSSGEKQMISLFAKLFLYEKPKIILIDEPELSLSIDWQREILADVMNAPNCAQVVAITHSPFVFDNELEPFARSLTLRATLPPVDLFGDDDFDA